MEGTPLPHTGELAALSNPAAAAAEYVRHGLALVPIRFGKKGPDRSGWNLAENAVKTPEAAALISGNLGLAHAYCSPAPTAALDIDAWQPALDWFAGRSIDLAALRDADDAVQILSGREGRCKLLYRLPPDLPPLTTVQVASCDGAMAVEFRCGCREGRTVQDVLPPSVHPNTGLPYRCLPSNHVPTTHGASDCP